MTDWPKFEIDKDRRTSVPAELANNALPYYISNNFADLRPEPDLTIGIDTQILCGENVSLLKQENDWALIQSIRDSYVGWTRTRNLSPNYLNTTHIVTAPRTFLYSQADMKSVTSGERGMGCLLNIVGNAETRGTQYFVLESGEAIIAGHLREITQFESDYVAVAEKLLRTPYLWGGASAYGIDCSGLVQLSMKLAGMDALRDSDMLAATIGEPISAKSDYSNVQRGDLVFWRGHVGICQGKIYGEQFLIHANGHTMDVTSEPLLDAIKRIEFLYERPVGVRRPDRLSA